MRLLRLPVFLLCLAALPLSAQNPEPAPPSTLKATAQAVVVDVVVTTPSGDPVPRLAQAQFQVLEDGKPQNIDLFEEHALPAAHASAAAAPALPPGVYSNDPHAPQAEAVNVLLIDNLNTEPIDQANVRRQIAGFLVNLPAGERVAVFSLTSRLRLIQGFTADPAQVRAALTGSPARSTSANHTRQDELAEQEDVAILAAMTGNADGGNQMSAQAQARTLAGFAGYQAGQRVNITLDALRQLARYLAGIPGRKNLLWFASSFPVTISPAYKDRELYLQGQELEKSIRQVSGLLTLAKVAVYPIAAEGVLADHTGDADSGIESDGANRGMASSRAQSARSANTAAMEQLAADTGGKAFYSSNDLTGQISSALRDGAHYYTLVYTPQNHATDGRFRRINVRLASGNYKLSYRRGYYALPADAATPGDPLAALLAHGLPASTQIQFQARVAQAAEQPAAGTPRAGGNAKLTGPLVRFAADLSLPADALHLETAPDGTRTGKVEVALVAYDAAGTALNWTGSILGLKLDPASLARLRSSGLPVHLEIDLPPTAVWLAAGVYDQAANKAGTLEIPIPAAGGTGSPAP
ncbi:MAG: VWA domain-containing protein [Terracidiphilus sp.]